MENIKEKQKLVGRNIYTPTDAPQTRGNCGHALNRDENLSVPGLKTSSNNPDVDIPPPAGGHKANLPVFILSKDGKPLMPCKPAKAKHLLKEKKAKVVQRTPFTIQLLWNCEEYTQPIALRIDPGYKHIGFSAVTEKTELISGEAVIRTDIPGLNMERLMYRGNNLSLQLNRKGFKPSIRRRRYSLQPGDTVIFQRKDWNIVGMHNVGKSVIIKKEEKKMCVSVKKVQLKRYGKGLKFSPQFLPSLKRRISLEVS